MAATASTRTAGDIIDGALRLIGVLAASQTAAAEDAQLGLESLAELMANWGSENLLVPSIANESFSLVIDQIAYVVGPGAAGLDTVRPENVLSVYITDTTVDYYCQLIGQGEYALLDKSTTHERPKKVWINYSAPTTTFTFWPKPDATDTANIVSTKQITEPTSLTDTMVTTCGVPRTYHNAFKFNLAEQLAPFFGKEAPATIMKIAAREKLTIINQIAKLRHEAIDPAYWSRLMAIQGMQIGGA